MSKFEQIVSFIAVVEENGFAAASRKYNLSRAAISRQITQLEAKLGVQLLVRTTRQIALTEIGEQYYQQCKTAMQHFAEAEDFIAGGQQEAKGVLRVVCNRYFAIQYLLPRLPEFMNLHPKLKVNFELAERFPDLTKEGVDIVFGVSVEGPEELVRKRVATTRYVLCAAPTYLKKHGMPKKPADLLQHQYIAHSMRKPKDVIRLKDKKEIYVEPRLMLNDTRAMRDCAIQGMGIVNLHDYSVVDALKNKQLIEVLPDLNKVQIPIYLYYQQSRYIQPKIRKFIDFYSNN